MSVGTTRRTVARRSFEGGPLRISRSVSGEPISVSVEFGTTGISPRGVELYVERWADGFVEILPMLPDSAGSVYAVDLCPGLPGVYRFRMRAKFDGDDTWVWDAFPFSYLNIDPPGIGDIRMYTYLPTVSGTIEDWIQ